MIALVPARGGSKGLPGKNVKILNGLPLIAYTIRAALEAKLISRVIVSTDSIEIAELSKDFGAEVPFMRPEFLARDESPAIDTYLHTIYELEQTEKQSVDEISILLPTSPLRSIEDIDGAIDMFHNRRADSIISYTKENHPISWHKYINEQNKFEDIFPQNIKNRQDSRPSYFPNGSIYVFKKSILEKGLYYTDNSFAYIMPRSRSIDIDYLEDFNYAGYLLSNRD